MKLKDGTYISWWPSNSRTDFTFGKKLPIYTATPNPNQTYANDVSSEGQKPNHVINIKGLNEAAIKKWWIDFKKKNKWKTFSQNCSSTIADGLDAGGGGKGVYWSDWNLIWAPDDVKAYAEALQ